MYLKFDHNNNNTIIILYNIFMIVVMKVLTRCLCAFMSTVMVVMWDHSNSMHLGYQNYVQNCY